MALVKLTFVHQSFGGETKAVAADTIKEVREYSDGTGAQVLIVRDRDSGGRPGILEQWRNVAESVDEVIALVNDAEQPRTIINEPTIQILAPEGTSAGNSKRVPFQPG